MPSKSHREVQQHVCQRVVRFLLHLEESSAHTLGWKNSFAERESAGSPSYEDICSDKVDLPDKAGTCNPCAVIPAELRELITDPKSVFPSLVSREGAAENISQLQLGQYRDLVVRELRCGKLFLREEAKGIGGVFAVGKSSGRQRKIWNGSAVSVAAASPPKPHRLANPSSFLDVEIQPDEQVFYARRDAATFFDVLQVPPEPADLVWTADAILSPDYELPHTFDETCFVATDDTVLMHKSRARGKHTLDRLDKAFEENEIPRNMGKDISLAESSTALGCDLSNGRAMAEPSARKLCNAVRRTLDLLHRRGVVFDGLQAKRKLSLRLQPFANHTYDDDISECSSLDSDADSDCSTDDEHDRGDKIVKVDVKERFENDNKVNELGSSRVREIVFYDGGDENELYEYDIGPDESKKIKKVGEAVLVRTVTYDMETYLDMTVKKYCDVTDHCVDQESDALLHHLMAYVHQSKHHLMIGWVGDSMEDSSIGLFADADYAGCGESLKTTSGARLHIQGPRARFPLAGLSKRQGCLSHSTPEAEIVAADFAMMRWGLPAITLWQQLDGKDPDFGFYDDNQTMIGMVRAGKNPTMRHLERTHGISIGWMRAIFQEGYVSLAYEVTAKMAADIHTKSFEDSISWTHACQLINIFPPDQIGSQDIMDLMRPTHSQSTDEKGQCFIARVFRVKKVCRSTTVSTPSWLFAAGTLFALYLDYSPVKFDRYVERAVFQYHAVRHALPATPVVEDYVQTSAPVPCGRRFVRTLAPEWRAVVAALARAIHGGYQDFTLPLRFNGRPDRNRISYLGLMVWTRIIEEVWEDRPQKMREREGYGKAIVPHVTELQDCKNGLVIEFYDSAKDLVHVYKDEGNRLTEDQKDPQVPRQESTSNSGKDSPRKTFSGNDTCNGYQKPSRKKTGKLRKRMKYLQYSRHQFEGEEEKAKLAKLREAEEAEEAEAAEAEVPDAEAESRKRKLDELEQKKKALQKENAKKQREIEEEEKRIRAVEEAGRRAKEQRAKQTPKVSVPMEKENWFEKKAIEHGEEQAKNRSIQSNQFNPDMTAAASVAAIAGALDDAPSGGAALSAEQARRSESESSSSVSAA
ncbi:unnamed protein product [Symbiodinium microadriaticum]|nr:unnamed protein product [Symbiodinium sp. KB8]CAE7413084.1 unnamed protein product [Symbiodinium microadriaticum]